MRNRSGEATTLSNIGEVYAALGEHQRAADHYDQSLVLARAIGDREIEASGLVRIARLEDARGNIAAAYAAADSGLTIIESLRASIANPDLRASYLASNRDPYELCVDLLMKMHRQRPSEGFDALALEVSERARARSLLEILSDTRADAASGIDPALIERKRRLQQQINAREQDRLRVLGGKPANDQVEAAKRAVEVLLTEFQEIQAEISEKSPRYAALSQPRLLSLRDIQNQLLDDDTLLLEYALGRNTSHLWAVTRTSMTTFALPGRSEIEQAARRAYELLTISHKRADKRQAELALAELSEIVLGPVANQLGRRRLIIVAEGALQYVPFGALYEPTRGPGSRTPLIVEHEIASLPSASVLAVQRRELAGRPPADRAVAVLADPVLQRADVRVTGAMDGSPDGIDTRGALDTDSNELPGDLERSGVETGIPTFDRLPFTRDEADAIVNLAGRSQSLKALDFDASRATLTGSELDRYRIIHIATHGILNSQHPELSGIVLSLVDEKGNPQDGFVRAHEIFDLKLRADLVVLSACRTALGKDVKGEGLVGLVRGFMYAGAARVMASLWDVRDEATAVLMKRFYEGMLRDGLNPVAALRAAQVSLWRDKRWKPRIIGRAS